MKNFYTSDNKIQAILKSNLPADFFRHANESLTNFGERVATAIDERAAHTDREGQPRLVKYDKMGNDISHVWVNEGYKQTVKETYNTGIVGYVHKEIPELGHQGNYLYSFAQGYLLSQAEPGFYCPVTLTMATAYLIDHYADQVLKDKFLPHVLATGDVELFEGATFLTERQGGSDVGANEVEAIEQDGYYTLQGEKYFASNAGMCGVAMVLARVNGAQPGTKGLSLFLVPWKDNNIAIRRLKDKLGVRAVPSAEVELDGAKGYLVGDAKKGFKYMMEALNLSRVCNAVASLGIMRRAFTEARDYAMEREAFGNKLIAYPMIQETLVQLAVKLEVETSSTFKLINLFDKVMQKNSSATTNEQALLRLYIAILKKETAEQSIAFCHEAIEMHGGNGYIEDFVTPRLLRDAQVLTVWEGTANILGLEVMRLMEKFRIHEVFIQEMKEQLETLPNGDLTEPLFTAIYDLEKFMNKIQQMDERTRLMYPKKIAKKMAAIFEGINAVIEAYGSGKSQAREMAIAKVFINMTFETKEDALPLDYFDLIVREDVTEKTVSSNKSDEES
ncbi:Acyl-CoA dehydrogenase [Virgibacillus subterraneus]|uniref:Acyl-CoA dehydrogenase n=1 Tax=Virgibacillus subterraneus TaxID=621109 RepID=A0A1H9BT16_9BACI|nr:acyl-CoA dehydrogenase family protein [Virgibacillus subterraneus]SEP92112.1 Acyl-CoA dehydrogenase [Virgibacillus subterraneus]